LIVSQWFNPSAKADELNAVQQQETSSDHSHELVWLTGLVWLMVSKLQRSSDMLFRGSMGLSFRSKRIRLAWLFYFDINMLSMGH
jgi:hypothetical protein